MTFILAVSSTQNLRLTSRLQGSSQEKDHLTLYPSKLPPATGYFSFETPLATGRGELTRSELGTSRVWSLLGAATVLDLHTDCLHTRVLECLI